jgi:predicted transcriptional regulator
MDKPTEPTDWRTVLKAQGRTIAWLADRTGRPRRTIYAYSRGDLRPTAEWLARAAEILGVEVAA